MSPRNRQYPQRIGEEAEAGVLGENQARGLGRFSLLLLLVFDLVSFG